MSAAVAAAKKASGTKATARRAPAAEKPSAAKAPVRKAPAKKAATTTASSSRSPAKKAPVAKAATRSSPAKKAPVAKATASRGGAVLARGTARKAPIRKTPAQRLAAEQTFDDDWTPPAPEPERVDPHVRVRGLLRAAARSLESQEGHRGTAAPPEEPVTRVLIAPEPAIAVAPAVDERADEEEEGATTASVPTDDWVEEPAVAEALPGDDWAPPDVIEAPEPLPAPVVAPVAPTASPVPTQPAPPWVPPSAAATPSATDGTKPRGRKRRWLLLLLLLVVLAGGGAVAYAATRDRGVDYSKLKVGDCFNSSSSNQVRGVKVIPCSKSHNSEIFFLVTDPAAKGAAYPGKDQLVQYAADTCLGQPLTDYLGIPLEQSKLKDFEIVPQASAWKDGRRVLVCGLDTGGQGRVTGSAKGSRR